MRLGLGAAGITRRDLRGNIEALAHDPAGHHQRVASRGKAAGGRAAWLRGATPSRSRNRHTGGNSAPKLGVSFAGG